MNIQFMSYSSTGTYIVHTLLRKSKADYDLPIRNMDCNSLSERCEKMRSEVILKIATIENNVGVVLNGQ